MTRSSSINPVSPRASHGGANKPTGHDLRILSTLIKPSSGSARVFNLDVEKDASEVRRIISYLPEEAGAYRNLSGREYLEFMANFYSINNQDVILLLMTQRRFRGWANG
jgi:ABC-type multidrug transport system ATPase subunit